MHQESFLYLFGDLFSQCSHYAFLYLFIKDNPSISTAIFIIIAGALAVILFCNIPEKKYETHYQVMVDDSVSMNEFQSKYEIIEVEGKIYTVKERVK